MAQQQALNRSRRSAENLATNVRYMQEVLHEADGVARMPSAYTVRRRLNVVIVDQTEFVEHEDQHLDLLLVDEEARNAEITYMDTIMVPTNTAIDAAEEYLQSQDPASAAVLSVDDVTWEREQARLAARAKVEAGRTRVGANAAFSIAETG